MEQPIRRELAGRWLAAAVLAWVAGGLLELVVYRRVSVQASTLFFLGGAAAGVTLGVLQWLVLRPHRIGLWWAIVTTAVLGLLSYGVARVWPGGLVLTYVPLWGPYIAPPSASVYLYFGVASAIAGCLFGSVTGALLGVGQWLVFRASRPATGRWIAANIVGLSVGFAASAIVLSCLTLSWGPNQSLAAGLLAVLASGGVRGVMSGAITSRTLSRLLRH